MKKLISLILSTITFLSVSKIVLAENILSKADADNIFKMRRAEWEKAAPRYVLPNGDVRLNPTSTGTVVAAFDKSTGYGLSIQPIYLDLNHGPYSLIVGCFYPAGTMKANFSEIQKSIETDSEKDLGASYKVSAEFVKVSPNIEEIELTVTLKPSEQ